MGEMNHLQMVKSTGAPVSRSVAHTHTHANTQSASPVDLTSLYDKKGPELIDFEL